MRFMAISEQIGFFFLVGATENEVNRLQGFWQECLRNLRAATLPENITDVMATINSWLPRMQEGA